MLASGSNYGVALPMVCCHFMEMQWKHAVCMHDGEYFHGPFETTDKSLPMVLLMDEGRTRALDERCLTFLKTYAENYIVIDFQAINKGRIDHAVAEFFSPVVMVPVERFYVSQMAIATGHLDGLPPLHVEGQLLTKGVRHAGCERRRTALRAT